jgi:hypothetical protein
LGSRMDANQRHFVGHNGGAPRIGFDFRCYPDRDDVVVGFTDDDAPALSGPLATVTRLLQP